MCGRMVLTRSADEIAQFFEASEIEDEVVSAPRYNVAPSQSVSVIREHANGIRRVASLSWGLIPFWAKSRESISPMINARSETAATKPSFRAAMKKRRCLVPVDGFYEWARKSKSRVSGAEVAPGPYYFRSSDTAILAIAAIWESWIDRESGEVLESCALLTVGANALMSPIHHRMPVLLGPADWKVWLNSKEEDSEKLAPLLKSAPPGLLEAFAVDHYVNHARNEGPRCIEPLV